jgi:hypothetical protein
VIAIGIASTARISAGVNGADPRVNATSAIASDVLDTSMGHRLFLYMMRIALLELGI